MKFWHSNCYDPTEQVVEIARIAEEVGFEGVWGADHAIYPRSMGSDYPYSADGKLFIDSDTEFPDPWVITMAMAAATTTLKFSTSIYILPLRNPVEVAKSAATLSVMTDNRFILGAGVGWMKEEFEAYGIDFSSRGRRTNEMIEVIRKLWGNDWVDFDGEFFQYDGIKICPRPDNLIPIYTGGSSSAALRRAAKYADGWIGHGNALEEVPALQAKLNELRAEYGREKLPFKTLIALTSPPDLDDFKRLADMGVSASVSYPLLFTLGAGSTVDEKRRHLEGFSENFIQPLA